MLRSAPPKRCRGALLGGKGWPPGVMVAAGRDRRTFWIHVDFHQIRDEEAIMKTARFLAASALAAGAFVFSPAASLQAQECGCQPAYRIVNKVVYDEVPVTQYRVEYENRIEEREVTST